MWDNDWSVMMMETVPYTGGANVQGTIFFGLIVIFTIIAIWMYNSR